ncbi:hypothetical protein BLA29_011722 [Euroglyphus maynei]|uniref:Uncharacterized protein n=1 Tax=Euroglyphus maynei TaxID=6958 RepID=A0A1Y3BK64_EURMA|nr:hypothetical protein BLA29_011722 [Euroglyphus maynei]
MIKRFLNRIHWDFDGENFFNPASTPYHIETSNWETLAYLIKQRFRMENISCEAFYDLSIKLIDDSPKIKRKFNSCLQKLDSGELERYLMK